VHALAAGLGRVHGDVGAAQQFLDGGGRDRGGGHADAHAHVQADVLHGEGLQDQRAQPLGPLLGLVQGDPGQQDGEFVATEPGQQLALAEGREQARTDLAQQLVAGGVPEAVVDLLEPVEVQQ
jgi:hypothetical protein